MQEMQVQTLGQEDPLEEGMAPRFQFSSVQSLSRVQLFATHELQHTRPPCPSPTPRVHPNPCLLCWWCHPTISSSVVPFSSCPQSSPASVFSNESTFRIRWAEYWNFSFNISPSSQHPGLISLRMDWLDLLAVGLLNISFLFFSSLLIFAISNFYWRSNFIMNIILKIKQEERIYTELAQPKIFFVVVYYFTLILYLASWPHSKSKN